MKRKIFWLVVLREFVKMLVVFAGLDVLLLPDAWISGGESLVLVIPAMTGFAAAAYILWGIACRLDRCIVCLRKQLARQEQWEREAPMREARRRQAWQRWFAEQEQGA